MRNRLFAVICVLLALAMLPGGASAKAKKAPKKDIGIQLYSVRSLIGVFGKSQGDYKPVLKQLADMGYTSVEAASYKDGMLYGQTPEQFRKDVEDAGMRVISTHRRPCAPRCTRPTKRGPSRNRRSPAPRRRG